MSNNQGSLTETKEILRSLVISCPEAVTIHGLDRDFRNSEGYPIPYGKLGFPNLELFLRSLTDTLYVEGNGNVRAVESSKSKHIDQMVAKQKSATRARKNKPTHRPSHQTNQPINHYNNSYFNNQVPLLNYPPLHLHQQQQFNLSPSNLLNCKYSLENTVFGGTQLTAMQRIHQLQYPMMNLPPNLVNRKLLNRPTHFPHQPPINNFNPNNYNNYTQNVMQSTSRLPPNMYYHNRIINNKTTAIPERIEVSSSSKGTETTINNLETTNEECEISKSEADYINEAMDRLKLNDKSKICDDVVPKEDHGSNEALPELSEFDPIFQINTPSNVVPFGQKIKRAELTLGSMKIGSKFPIFVTEIHNPTKFWFHLAEQTELYDNLMNDIAEFYNSDGLQDFQISSINIRKGQLCAAHFIGTWHRGEIVSDLMDGGKVKVFFVDYGTTATLEIKSIKYLLKPFANLTGQIYRGALSSIRPLNSHRWIRDATYFMLSLVMDLIVHAKVMDIDYENQVISLCLIDTNKNIDLHINNEMIIKGYAMADNQKWSQQVNLTKTSIFYKIYPTFEMLEKGEYPSFYEIGLYLDEGFDLYKCEDATIVPGVDTPNRNVNKNISVVKSTLNPLSVSWYPLK